MVVLIAGFNGLQGGQLNCQITCKVNIIGLAILFMVITATIGKFFDARFLRRMIVINAIAILVLNSIHPFYILLKETRNNARKFLFESNSAMKQRNYGECDNMGYGYLEKIISPIPEPEIFPTVRYRDFNHFPHVLFADSRTQYDDRLLVGIASPSNDTEEAEITQAQFNSVEIDPPQITWTFQTRDDYDLLTGMVINLDNETVPQSQTLLVTLYESPIKYVVMGQWDVVILEGQRSVTYSINDPVQGFSHNRGATDFILTIKSRDHVPLPNIDNITLLGVKVDMSNYIVFNRISENGRQCFAAIKNSFLNEIDTNNDTEWQDYLNEVSNVDTGH